MLAEQVAQYEAPIQGVKDLDFPRVISWVQPLDDAYRVHPPEWIPLGLLPEETVRKAGLLRYRRMMGV